MIHKLYYNWKDIPKALKFAFSVKKIWTQFIGLLIGTIGYSVFAYIGLIVSGEDFTSIWHQWHFIPLPAGEPFTFWGRIILYIGILFFVVINLFYGTAVTKITFEQLKGHEFYDVREAVSFAFKKGKPVIFSPLTLLFIMLLIVVGGIILGLIAKIIYLGQIVLIISAIPAFFAAFFLIYLFFALIVSLLLSAAIVSSQDNDTFDTLFEVFSSLNDQNWRIVLYEAILAISGAIGTFIYVWVIGRSIWIAETILSWKFLLGHRYIDIENGALYYFTTSPYLEHFRNWLHAMKVEAILNVPSMMPVLHIRNQIVAFIFGILLYLIVFATIAFPLVIYWTGNLLIYLNIAKKKDDIEYIKEDKEEEETNIEVKEESEEKSDTEEKEKEEGEQENQE